MTFRDSGAFSQPAQRLTVQLDERGRITSLSDSLAAHLGTPVDDLVGDPPSAWESLGHLVLATACTPPQVPHGTAPTTVIREIRDEAGQDWRIRLAPDRSSGWRVTLDPELDASSDTRVIRRPPSHDRKLGPYRLVERIGRGGVGEVWKALDQDGRIVAVKTLIDPEPGGQGPERLRREHAVLSKLRHPHLIRVHAIGNSGDIEWFAMDYVHGRDLAVWAREQPRTWRQRATMVEKAARAVHHAHQNGVIHRDLKPANILVDSSGEPRVTDFGLARAVHATGLTLPDQALGTPPYMPPEQAQAQHDRIGPRSDVWSLGAVLYELCCGRPPFTGETAYEVLTAVVEREPPAVRRLDPTVPLGLAAICGKCLQKRIEDRYASAEELADDLARFRNGERVTARPPGYPSQMWRIVRRRPLQSALMASVVAMAALLGSWLWRDNQSRSTDWVVVANRDFTAGDDLGPFQILTSDLGGTTVPVTLDRAGLAISPGSWLWLEGANLRNEARVKVEVDLPLSESIEIALGARRERLQEYWHRPAGLTAKSDNGNSAKAYRIYRESSPGDGRPVVGPSAVVPGSRLTYVLTRLEGRASLSCGDRVLVEAADVLPLPGSDLGGMGVRAWQASTRILRITVERRSLARVSSPVATGDALVEAGALALALDRYRSISVDQAGTALAAEALEKTCLVARLLGPDWASTAVAARERLASDYRNSMPTLRLLADEALTAWRNGDLDEAEYLLAQISAVDPNHGAAITLANDKQTQITAARLRHLAPWLRRLKQIDLLDLSGIDLSAPADVSLLVGIKARHLLLIKAKISDVRPLSGMPLSQLSLRQSTVIDLAPLAGLQLKMLDCSESEVSDLSPLATMPLERLLIGRTRVTDLSPLAKLPIKFLDVSELQFINLAPLAMLPLVNLDISHTHLSDLAQVVRPSLVTLMANRNDIVDLAPLSQCRSLNRLAINANAITSLAPLQGLRLISLDCSNNQVSSLAPLAGMPLRRLDAQSNLVADLSPLRGLPLAMFNAASNRLTDLAPIRSLRLNRLELNWNQVTDLSPLTGMPLATLLVDGNAVQSLAPLSGCPLAELSAKGNRIVDLAPLRGLPIQRLGLSGNLVTNAAPLAGCTLLRAVDLAGNQITDPGPLERLDLRILDLQDNPLARLPIPPRNINQLQAGGAPLDADAYRAWSRELASSANLKVRTILAEDASTLADLLAGIDPATGASGAMTLGGSLYRRIPLAMTWAEAAGWCQKHGAKLATWNDLDQLKKLSDLARPEIWCGAIFRKDRLEWSDKRTSAPPPPPTSAFVPEWMDPKREYGVLVLLNARLRLGDVTHRAYFLAEWPEKSAELPEKSAELLGKSAELPGKSTESPGKSTELPGKSTKSPGKSGEAPAKAADGPVSAPVTPAP
ncbi:hypothetical protein LBMAG53_34240 [Planctomycetota bacterium]|nr:hypothetical protein LBMAG53_34240 [Planctomycetota bacterium]